MKLDTVSFVLHKSIYNLSVKCRLDSLRLTLNATVRFVVIFFAKNSKSDKRVSR